jgi:hypothetical protein
MEKSAQPWGFWRIMAMATGVAIVLTWPLALHLGSAHPSPLLWRAGDPNIFIWSFDWLARAVLGSSPASPSAMLFYPDGFDPLGGYDGILIMAAGTLLRLVTGSSIAAYNLLVLAAFPLSAAASYALVWHATRSRFASATGAFIFAFSPYMLVRATQHLNLAMTFVIPLAALCFIRFAEAPDGRRARALAGATLLAALCSWYYLVFSGVFMVLAGLAFHRRLLRRPLMTVAAAAMTMIAATLPALPMLTSSRWFAKDAPLDEGAVAAYGADPLNYLAPHPLTNVFGGLTRDVYGNLAGGAFDSINITESTSYAGPLLIALAVLAFASRKRLKIRYAGFWAAVAVVFIVLSFGLSLPLGAFQPAMPYRYLWNRFPFSLIRAPDRFFIVAYLAMTVLASGALVHAAALFKTPFGRKAAFAVLAAAFLAERVMLPYPLYETRVSPFYRTLAQEPGTGAVAELPITFPGRSEYNFYQTVHGRPIAGGEYFYTAYTKKMYRQILTNDLLSASMCVKESPARVPNMPTALGELKAAGFSYVIVHNLVLLNNPFCPGLKAYLHRAFAGIPIHYTDGEITVYKL